LIDPDHFHARLTSFDLWVTSTPESQPRWRTIDATALGPRLDCTCCAKRHFEFLNITRASHSTTLCGQNAIQITPTTPGTINLEDLASRLRPLGPVTLNRFLLRATLSRPGFDKNAAELTVFPDARAVVKGTTNPALARAVYAQFVGT
jgi:adenylyltransferase/sulfurtransferase